jgi:hypothetical protein
MQFWGTGGLHCLFGNFDVNITVPADHVMEQQVSFQIEVKFLLSK